MSRSKPLNALTRHEHETLKKMGFLWQLYPEAAGDYSIDTGQLRTNSADSSLRWFSRPSFVRPAKTRVTVPAAASR